KIGNPMAGKDGPALVVQLVQRRAHARDGRRDREGAVKERRARAIVDRSDLTVAHWSTVTDTPPAMRGKRVQAVPYSTMPASMSAPMRNGQDFIALRMENLLPPPAANP